MSPGNPNQRPQQFDPKSPDNLEFWKKMNRLARDMQKKPALKQRFERDPASVIRERGMNITVFIDQNGKQLKLAESFKGLDKATTKGVANFIYNQAMLPPGSQNCMGVVGLAALAFAAAGILEIVVGANEAAVANSTVLWNIEFVWNSVAVTDGSGDDTPQPGGNDGNGGGGGFVGGGEPGSNPEGGGDGGNGGEEPGDNPEGGEPGSDPEGGGDGGNGGDEPGYNPEDGGFTGTSGGGGYTGNGGGEPGSDPEGGSDGGGGYTGNSGGGGYTGGDSSGGSSGSSGGSGGNDGGGDGGYSGSSGFTGWDGGGSSGGGDDGSDGGYTGNDGGGGYSGWEGSSVDPDYTSGSGTQSYGTGGPSREVRGTGTPVRGSGTQSYGTGGPSREVRGTGTPVRGSGTNPFRGSGTQIQGSGEIHGTGTPIQGSGTPVRGSGNPFRGSGTQIQGSGEIRGTGTPIQGSGTPVRGSGSDTVQGAGVEDIRGFGITRGSGSVNPAKPVNTPSERPVPKWPSDEGTGSIKAPGGTAAKPKGGCLTIIMTAILVVISAIGYLVWSNIEMNKADDIQLIVPGVIDVGITETRDIPITVSPSDTKIELELSSGGDYITLNGRSVTGVKEGTAVVRVTAGYNKLARLGATVLGRTPRHTDVVVSVNPGTTIRYADDPVTLAVGEEYFIDTQRIRLYPAQDVEPGLYSFAAHGDTITVTRNIVKGVAPGDSQVMISITIEDATYTGYFTVHVVEKREDGTDATGPTQESKTQGSKKPTQGTQGSQSHIHNWVLVKASDPGCTTPGYYYYECECGETKRERYCDPLGHDPVEYEEMDPTGFTVKHHRCARCGQELD